MRGGGATFGEYLVHVCVEVFATCGKQCRVDVALQGYGAVEQGVRCGQRQAVVHTDDVCTGFVHGGQQGGGAGAEVDARHTVFAHHVEGGCGVRLHVAAVVAFAEGACPGVEELHGGCARLDLCAQELACGAGCPGGEFVPGGGVGVHHGARAQVVAGGAAFDHVGGDGEGGSGEADERGVAEHFYGGGDGFADGVEVAVFEFGQGAHLVEGADGLVEYGAPTGHDVDVDARKLHGDDDVGEEDAGVDLVAADGLHGDFCGEVGGEACVQHGDAFARLAVFGQGAACLAHEPDGSVAGGAAGEGAEHGRVGGGACAQGVVGG